MPTVKIIVQIPQEMKEKMDILRTEGHTMSGYIRHLVAKDLEARELSGRLKVPTKQADKSRRHKGAPGSPRPHFS